ncbi:MAG: PaaI family thioesterase [Clostridia bacterium]|nr:PaaI family thioesterase [Clostridia bacterium]
MKVVKEQTIAKDCLICGENNPLGLHAHFYEMENGKVVSIATFKNEHQSYPNRVHGGMITALLDETIGRALWTVEPDVFAVTTEISVKFRKPVPLNEEIKCVAELLKNTPRGFIASAKIIDKSGQVLATGQATYFKVNNDMVDSSASEMFLPKNRNNITEIDI